MKKKYLIYAGLIVVIILAGYYMFISQSSYSTGYRAGELIKISHKGVIFRTWEGELAQGISESQFFKFSVTDKEVVEQLKELQGKRVRLAYKERYRTFPWWGDTRYFVTGVEERDYNKGDTEDLKETDEAKKPE